MCRVDHTAGVVQQMTQQPIIDWSVQGGWWLATTAVGKDKGKYYINRE